MLDKRSKTMLIGALALVAIPTAGIAGPCSDDIAALGRKLSDTAALGPATTGALAGSGPGAVKTADAADTTGTIGTSADTRMGGTGGTKEINAASAQVATSADDVRRQQEGLPTAAQAATQGSGASVETAPKQASTAQPNDKMSQAKMEWQKARDLDQKNDSACMDSVKRSQQLMGG